MIPDTPLPHKSGHIFSIPFGDSSVVVCMLTKRPPHWEKDTLGMWQPFDYVEDLPACIGTIELLTKHMGAGYVTHEFTHALLCYIDAKGWELQGDNFEDICYAISDAVTLCWNKYYQLYPHEEPTEP